MALKLLDIVADRAIVPQLRAQDRDGVVAELVDALVRAGAVRADQRDAIVQAVLAREKHSSTGFGKGVAVPHVKHASITRMTAAVGLSARGVDFNALDRQPVYTIFLLLSPVDSPEDHLLAMEVIFRNLSKDQFRRQLRQASDAAQVRAVLEESDQQQSIGG